ncbi:hypothetical protein A1OE_1207 [Candidatus Endolissoclinum faulkneri L2]|uniref:Uncharacterized protein n=1 Tax=Candidatus Endolissoclinum faulkneri L2 TaxID=1193729 RepID=K7Z5P1_9PROT|nr:hypothetical protein A1OE_1207 [Candidatus Endolissoclinum faulkneri L2]
MFTQADISLSLDRVQLRKVVWLTIKNKVECIAIVYFFDIVILHEEKLDASSV